jgi:O-antigen/teichoic acid export membrane protein
MSLATDPSPPVEAVAKRRAAHRAPASGWRSSAVVRQASALMSSTMLASALNMLFWVAAARLYPTAAVGHGNATVSAIALVSGVAQLNLQSVFVRFLPHAGRRTTNFLASGYAGILFASVVLGSGYVLLGFGSGFGLGAWDPLAFVLAVAVYALFYVQDGVLTTFERAGTVVVKHVATSGSKLVLLVALVATGSKLGIAAAWCIPAVVTVVLVSFAIFRRWAPRRSQGESRLPGPKQLGNFVAAEYVNNLVGNVVTLIPPVLVLHLTGATANAYFAVPWLIVITLQTLVWNIMMSFIASAGRAPEALASHLRRTAGLVAAVALAGTAGLVVLGPLVLSAQGGEFAAGGGGVLRVAALSFPFTAVVIFYSGFALLENRLWRAVFVQAFSATLFVAGSVLLLPRLGLPGVGWAYLLGQAVAALVLVPELLTRFRAASKS